MEKETWNILEVVNWTTEYFEKKGIDSPRLNIELMLCAVLNIKRIDVYTQFDKPLTQNERTILRNMVMKRAENMPLQYILGKTEFLGFNILVNDSVMIPRPETELLVRKIISEHTDKLNVLSILDIGTGSGCIALTLAKTYINSKVMALDNSYFALLTAKNNASNLAVRNVEFNQCDILAEYPTNTKFDIVVSNPPYIPLVEYEKLQAEVKDYEPRNALTDGTDGLTFYKRMAEIINDLLKPDGIFYLEIGYGQKENVRELFESKAFKLEFFNDFSNIPRFLSGKRIT